MYVCCRCVCVRAYVCVCARAGARVCARACVVCVYVCVQTALFKPTGAVRHEPHSPVDSASTAGRFNVPSAGCCEGAGGTGSVDTDRLQITQGGINIQ